MAFFGITAFGPQNNFQTGLVNAIGLTQFNEEEYKAAFTKIDKDQSGFITVNEVLLPLSIILQLHDLLLTTYGFEPLEEEVESIYRFFS